MSYEKSSDQRTLDWAEIIESALTAPGNVGNTYNRFYEYSFLNQIYLRMQGVTEPVATYKRWQAIGRQVVRGAKAKEIIRPVIIHKQHKPGETEGTDETIHTVERIVAFKAERRIFALSDTVGDELPPVQLPEWDLDTALQQLDIHLVPFDALSGNLQGYSRGRDIAINPVAVNPTKTRFHEIGHVVLGHTAPGALAEYQQHRGIFEFQAEATAYLTMKELDRLDEETATRSRGYVQTWLQGERPPDKAIREVFTATDTILKAGRIAVAGMVEEIE
jgi:hypothetical protein